MKIRRTSTFAVGFAFLVAATLAAQTASAQKTSGPTPIKDTENPARSAVQSACILSWTNIPGQAQCVLMTVPTNKRLVVEHVSAACTAQGTDLIYSPFIETTLAAAPQTTVGNYLVLTGVGTTQDGHVSNASQSMRAYSDPGSTVKAKAALSGDPTDSYQVCYFSFTGHLVDVQ